jgi:hypothetical protein
MGMHRAEICERQLDRITDSKGMAETVDELLFVSPTLAMFLYTLTSDY